MNHYILAYVFRQSVRKAVRRANRLRRGITFTPSAVVASVRSIDYFKWKQDPDGCWSPRYQPRKKVSCVKDQPVVAE